MHLYKYTNMQLLRTTTILRFCSNTFPGITTVFAQFNINQFRAIAWFNVAVGLAYIVLQLVMFHGEGSFRKVKRRCQLMHIHKYWNGPFELFIS